MKDFKCFQENELIFFCLDIYNSTKEDINKSLYQLSNVHLFDVIEL
jgi:hypothetical protein